jgi:acetyl-CoA acetyltransferase
MQLEAYGFCGRGEAKDFVKAGGIAIDGATPINTNGGLIGEAYVHGMNLITEAVRQVRGCAANQVKDVETALVSSGFGGVILGKY